MIDSDEAQALAAIYGDDFELLNENFAKIHLQGLCLTVDCSKYPLEMPAYSISSDSKPISQKLLHEIDLKFKESWDLCPGQVILHTWASDLADALASATTTGTVTDTADAVSAGTITSNSASNNVVETDTADAVSVTIFSSKEPVIDKKSIFLGHCARINSQEQANQAVKQLLKDRKVAKATHNIMAYRIQLENGFTRDDCDDDGETAAGSRLLHLLQTLNLSNVIVVVSRWYGGIQLGPARFKHINNAARNVLAENNFLN